MLLAVTNRGAGKGDHHRSPRVAVESDSIRYLLLFDGDDGGATDAAATWESLLRIIELGDLISQSWPWGRVNDTDVCGVNLPLSPLSVLIGDRHRLGALALFLFLMPTQNKRDARLEINKPKTQFLVLVELFFDCRHIFIFEIFNSFFEDTEFRLF